jgi:hypothetical protein
MSITFTTASLHALLTHIVQFYLCASEADSQIAMSSVFANFANICITALDRILKMLYYVSFS